MYLVGVAFCVLVAVACVFILGAVLGTVAAVAIVGGTVAVLKYIRRRHYDPMAVYEAERSLSAKQVSKFHR